MDHGSWSMDDAMAMSPCEEGTEYSTEATSALSHTTRSGT